MQCWPPHIARRDLEPPGHTLLQRRATPIGFISEAALTRLAGSLLQYVAANKRSLILLEEQPAEPLGVTPLCWLPAQTGRCGSQVTQPEVVLFQRCLMAS